MKPAPDAAQIVMPQNRDCKLRTSPDKNVPLATLGLFYLSGLSILFCIGPSVREWLCLDLMALITTYLQQGCLRLPYQQFYQRIIPRGIWLHIGLCGLTIVMILALGLMMPDPSYAFFKEAQTTLEKCFSQAKDAISIFFMVLRFLLIAYIAAQLIFAIFQISRGESPLPLLLPALAVVIAIAIASVVTSLVLSDTTCTALLPQVFASLSISY